MRGAERLAGNGVELVRERALAARMQAGLERVYGLDRVADVGDFVRGAGEGEREALLLRESEDGALEMAIRLPALEDDATLDTFCQIIEGVSHFVYLVERARANRSATHLELEVQAEVDKWLLLAGAMRQFDVARSEDLRERLYERVSFCHAPVSDAGERYRLANDAAHGFVRRLERRYVAEARFVEMRAELRRFFHEGQEEKLRLARSA